MFAAFSGSFPEVVSHEEAGTCGVAIDEAFILITKEFSKSSWLKIWLCHICQ
jgi:hypothetical protein